MTLRAYFRVSQIERGLEKNNLKKYTEELVELIKELPFGKIHKYMLMAKGLVILVLVVLTPILIPRNEEIQDLAGELREEYANKQKDVGLDYLAQYKRDQVEPVKDDD